MVELKKTLLVVEDAPLQAIVLKRFLTMEGYDVVTAKNGKEALDFLKKQKFDLVISDVTMPEMNGFELCHAIKTDLSLRAIPVVLCTALSDPKDLLKGIEVGANDYLTKPWDEGKLRELVKDLLASPIENQAFLSEKEEVYFRGDKYEISTSKQNMLNFLLTTYDNVYLQNMQILKLKEDLQQANESLKKAIKDQEELMFNVFPRRVVEELLAYGSVTPSHIDNVAVGFTDFVNFTNTSSKLSPKALVELLGYYFENFDSIIAKREVERIKTIGDGYMFAAGISDSGSRACHDCAAAALDIRDFIRKSEETLIKKYGVTWKVRMGIHYGSVVSGVIGKARLAYDIWGATVNIASKLEAASEPDKINISEAVFEKIKDNFKCTSRGVIPVTVGHGYVMNMPMYFVEEPII